MNLQVLVSTMYQTGDSIIDKMNIQSDAIIINQCNRNEINSIRRKGKNILLMSFKERGVGLSRNNALMRASADICLMADDDMVYMDGYSEIVKRAFKNNPDADIIMFNVPIHKKNGDTIIKIKKNGRVRLFNALKYGTVNIAFRREVINKNNIFFSLLFGGGARYGSGEDSLFIVEALRKGLKIYSSREVIAEIVESESTWFTGYNEQYFFDKGVLFAAISKRYAKLLSLQFCIRHRKKFSNEKNFYTVYKLMLKGIKEFNQI